jgi:hypothetical protein
MTIQKAILSCMLASLAVPIVENTRRAMATPTTLACKEQKGMEETKRSSSSPLAGESKTAIEDEIKDFWTIPITVDAAAGMASVWGRPFELTVEPATLNLRETTREERGTLKSEFITHMRIERKTLRFEYTRLSLINGKLSGYGIWSSSINTRKSQGLCSRVKAVEGAKI